MFLLLGAVVNVAVAWSLAAFGPMLQPLPLDPDAPFRLRHIERIGVTSRFGPNRESATSGIMYDWRGWPTKTMKSLTRMGTQGDYVVDWPAFGIVIEPTRTDNVNLHFPRVLPLLPLFPGFAINALLYAVMIGVLWAATRSIIALRYNRGHEPQGSDGKTRIDGR